VSASKILGNTNIRADGIQICHVIAAALIHLLNPIILSSVTVNKYRGGLPARGKRAFEWKDTVTPVVEKLLEN